VKKGINGSAAAVKETKGFGPPVRRDPLGALLLAAVVAIAIGASLYGCHEERADPAGAQAGENPDYILDPEDGDVLATYTVVRAFAFNRWGWPGPPKDFLLAGTKTAVATRLGKYTFQAGDERLPDLGEGVTGWCFGGSERLYRDVRGIRLLTEEYIWTDTLILTAKNHHPAQLVDQDFAKLRTDSGIALGDSEERLLQRLGVPSQRDEFGEYDILWYLEKPQHVVEAVPESEWPDYEYDEGHAAAYALENGEVVEIWLHEWTTEVLGG